MPKAPSDVKHQKRVYVTFVHRGSGLADVLQANVSLPPSSTQTWIHLCIFCFSTDTE